MSTEIEYCDNRSCLLNKKNACTHPGPLDVDESGSCVSAAYEDGGGLPPSPDEPFDISPPDDDNIDDVWFKKI